MLDLVLDILGSGIGIAAMAVLVLVACYRTVCHLAARGPWRRS